MIQVRFLWIVIYTVMLSVSLNSITFVYADATVDNRSTDTSQTGTWLVSGGSNPFDPNDPAADSIWARGGGDTFTWHFTPLDSGSYEVSEWHTGWASRTDAAPHLITYAGGETTVFVDQKVDAGQWNAMGVFQFVAGQNYTVTVTSVAGNASTCADAIRWTQVSSGNLTPTAFIDSIIPNPADLGDTVTLTGSGSDIDGNIVAYQWDSSLDGPLSSNTSFSTSTLSAGTHTITFSVQDNESEWSDLAIQVLNVTIPAQEIIRDNKDPDTSQTGSWSVSGGTNPFDPTDSTANSMWARGGEDTFSWHFTAPQTGEYEVWEWHTGWSSRTSAAPHVITHAGGLANISVNQQSNAGQWNSLGSYPFVAGESYLVTVTSVADSSSTCADAMRWTLVSSGNNLPTASIESVAPNPADEGEVVAFTGSGSDSDGSIAAYRWRSSIDGDLSGSAFFSSSTLSLGAHTITFEVQDNDGDWSVPVTQVLTIQATSVNNPPTASIDAITPNPADEGEAVNFTGHCEDTDGTVTAFRWTSSINGTMSNNMSFSSTTLSLGTHTITFEVQDNDGDWSVPVTQVLTIQATSVNNPPTASIDAITPNPADEGEAVNFTGHCEDTDGTVTAFRWTSSINGTMSNNMSFSSTTLSLGTHTITFEVQDNDGDWSVPVTQVLTIQAISVNNPPTASIDAITPNPADEGEAVNFTGHCEDTDGTVAAFRWTSSINGTMSNNMSFSSTTLSLGTHTITFEVQDNDGDWSVPVTQVLTIGEFVEEIIRDNGDPETSQTGTWEKSSGSHPFDPLDPSADSLWARGGDTYSWYFTAPQTGTFEVWEWHTGWSSRTSAASHRVTHADGETTIFVDQSVNAGQWNSMGVYPFVAGEVYLVTVTSAAGSASTCADAIRWTMDQSGLVPDGDGTVVISGELNRWHKVTLTLDGPYASENGGVNPFLDYRMDVVFTNGDLTYTVPGYFAADGDAANTSSNEGTKWRAHLSPDLVGSWHYLISFRQGPNVAVAGGGDDLVPYQGISGTFTIMETDKGGRDLRGKGRLTYTGQHHLQFAGSGEYFLKVGADSPENFLAYADFDNTPNLNGFLKSWAPHAGDWNPGDQVWKGALGKNIIGALNYLSQKGMNAFSFLTLSYGGDDGNVFMWCSPDSRTRFDCSKLDQWEIVFSHADAVGMFMEFKTQEEENDQLLDGGALNTERKLYYRELIARYGHHLSLTWNLGEENTNTDEQRRAFCDFIRELDPYDHLIVAHTRPSDKDAVYVPLLGYPTFDGASLQSEIDEVHRETKHWIDRSAANGRPWIVTNDEQNPFNEGVLPDAEDFWHNNIRKHVLWGNIMAGGAGVGYYFGYDHAPSDLTCEDWRTRDHMWDMSRYAHELFVINNIPFWEMEGDDELTDNSDAFCLYKHDEVYVVYLKDGGTTNLDLTMASCTFEVNWFDPQNGGALMAGSITHVTGGVMASLGSAPHEADRDWVVVIQSVDGP